MRFPPAISDNPLVITQSDVSAFKRCRRSWFMGSYLGFRPQHEPPFGPLALGTRVHEALDRYYTDDQNPVEAYSNIAHAELEKLNASGILFDRNAWEKETALGQIMLEGYLEWVQDTGADSDYEVIGAEHKLTYQTEIAGQIVELRGKIDLRVRNRRTGARLACDHKTAASIDALIATATMNEQLHFYALLERLVDTDRKDDWVEGGMLNMLRKVKRGEASRPPYYDRVEIHFNETTLRSYWTRLQGTLTDYIRTVNMLKNGYDHKFAAYPTPSDACRWCSFKPVCQMMDDGSGAEDMADTLYEQRDPLERYNDSKLLPLLTE
jgi:RecB family exonuclease